MDVLEQAEELHIDLDALMRIIVHSTEVRDSATLLQLIGTEVTEIFRDDAVASGRDEATRAAQGGGPGSQDQPEPGSAGNEKTENAPLPGAGNAPAPITFQVGRDNEQAQPAWTNIFMKYGLRNSGEHSALDMQRMFGSHFIFSNIPGQAGERETFLLKLLSPHLHFALMRTLQTENDSLEKRAAAFDRKQ